jgi:hypothetical protein
LFSDTNIYVSHFSESTQTFDQVEFIVSSFGVIIMKMVAYDEEVHVSEKWVSLTTLHDAMSQKAVVFIMATVRTWNLT